MYCLCIYDIYKVTNVYTIYIFLSQIVLKLYTKSCDFEY